MQKNANLSEWGIPDWQDAANYGNTETWNLQRWRWEFFRRNDRLRACFDHYAEGVVPFGKKLNAHEQRLARLESPVFLLPSEAGFTTGWNTEHLKEFGYGFIPNPRISDQPASVISGAPESTPQVYNGKGTPWGEEWPIHCPDGHMAMVFNLDEPLAAQLESAKESLKTYQIIRSGKKLQTKRHPKKWLTYLRVIDAKADDASWSKIADILPNTLSKTDQNARDVWQQANALCSNF